MNENETHTELPAHGDEIEGYIELPAPSAIAFATSIDADGPEYRYGTNRCVTPTATAQSLSVHGQTSHASAENCQ